MKLDAEVCLVLVTNNHVFEEKTKAKKSRIKFQGRDKYEYLDDLMVEDSFITNKEVC